MKILKTKRKKIYSVHKSLSRSYVIKKKFSKKKKKKRFLNETPPVESNREKKKGQKLYVHIIVRQKLPCP